MLAAAWPGPVCHHPQLVEMAVEALESLGRGKVMDVGEPLRLYVVVAGVAVRSVVLEASRGAVAVWPYLRVARLVRGWVEEHVDARDAAATILAHARGCKA